MSEVDTTEYQRSKVNLDDPKSNAITRLGPDINYVIHPEEVTYLSRPNATTIRYQCSARLIQTFVKVCAGSMPAFMRKLLVDDLTLLVSDADEDIPDKKLKEDLDDTRKMFMSTCQLQIDSGMRNVYPLEDWASKVEKVSKLLTLTLESNPDVTFEVIFTDVSVDPV